MEIKDSRRGEHLVLEVSGELDFSSADRFGRHCGALVEQGELRIVLDLSKLKYLSSAGLRAILLLERQLRQAGGQLALCAPSEPAKMVLTIAGFLDKFTVYASLDDLAG